MRRRGGAGCAIQLHPIRLSLFECSFIETAAQAFLTSPAANTARTPIRIARLS
jgi:hypothetical protein